jgi:hypothetical protein
MNKKQREGENNKCFKCKKEEASSCPHVELKLPQINNILKSFNVDPTDKEAVALLGVFLSNQGRYPSGGT